MLGAIGQVLELTGEEKVKLEQSLQSRAGGWLSSVW